MGRAAAYGSVWLPVYFECHDRIGDDPLWRDGCLDFPQNLDERSQSLLNRGIAIGMQVMIAEEKGDELALAYLQEEVEMLKRIPGYDPCRGEPAPPGQ